MARDYENIKRTIEDFFTGISNGEPGPQTVKALPSKGIENTVYVVQNGDTETKYLYKDNKYTLYPSVITIGKKDEQKFPCGQYLTKGSTIKYNVFEPLMYAPSLPVSKAGSCANNFFAFSSGLVSLLAFNENSQYLSLGSEMYILRSAIRFITEAVSGTTSAVTLKGFEYFVYAKSLNLMESENVVCKDVANDYITTQSAYDNLYNNAVWKTSKKTFMLSTSNRFGDSMAFGGIYGMAGNPSVVDTIEYDGLEGIIVGHAMKSSSELENYYKGYGSDNAKAREIEIEIK